MNDYDLNVPGFFAIPKYVFGPSERSRLVAERTYLEMQLKLAKHRRMMSIVVGVSALLLTLEIVVLLIVPHPVLWATVPVLTALDLYVAQDLRRDCRRVREQWAELIAFQLEHGV
jgi:hypothetical protein